MSYRVLIVDDEPLARARLARLVAAINGFDVVAQAASGDELWGCLACERVDICLLDIHLPGLSGLALAEQLNAQQHPPTIIFCTAYEEHALAAFEHQAADYVLKPVRQDRLAAALARAVALRGDQAKAPADEAPLVIQIGERIERIDWGSVRALVAEDKYVNVITADGEYLSSGTLAQFEADKPERLVRIHRATLVSAAHIKALLREGEGMCVELHDTDARFAVSRRHLAPLRRHLKDNGGTLA